MKKILLYRCKTCGTRVMIYDVPQGDTKEEFCPQCGCIQTFVLLKILNKKKSNMNKMLKYRRR